MSFPPSRQPRRRFQVNWKEWVKPLHENYWQIAASTYSSAICSNVTSSFQ